MDKKVILEFTKNELREIVMNYYGIEEEDFDISDYDDEEIKRALLEWSCYC